jgi:hypothetical protein
MGSNRARRYRANSVRKFMQPIAVGFEQFTLANARPNFQRASTQGRGRALCYAARL